MDPLLHFGLSTQPAVSTDPVISAPAPPAPPFAAPPSTAAPLPNAASADALLLPQAAGPPPWAELKLPPGASGATLVLSGTGLLGGALGRYLGKRGNVHFLVLGLTAAVSGEWRSMVQSPSARIEMTCKNAVSQQAISLMNQATPRGINLVIQGQRGAHAAAQNSSRETLDHELRFLNTFSSNCGVMLLSSCSDTTHSPFLDSWISIYKSQGKSVWNLELRRPGMEMARPVKPARVSSECAFDVLQCLLDDNKPLPWPAVSVCWQKFVSDRRACSGGGISSLRSTTQGCSVAAWSRRCPQSTCARRTPWAERGAPPTDVEAARTAIVATEAALWCLAESDGERVSHKHRRPSPSGSGLRLLPPEHRVPEHSDHDYPQLLCSQQPAVRHWHLPRPTNLAQKYGAGAWDGGPPSSKQDIADANTLARPVTTLMVRNLPNGYTRGMLLLELDTIGLKGKYDFVYLPIDRSTQWNVGYAFVNFATPEDVNLARSLLSGYMWKRFRSTSSKFANVSDALIQGREDNLQHYSSTAVQRSRVEARRPLVLGC